MHRIERSWFCAPEEFDTSRECPPWLVAVEVPESGKWCQERGERGKREQSLHLHDDSSFLEAEVLERLGRPAVEMRRTSVVPAARREIALCDPSSRAVTGRRQLFEAGFG